MPLTSRELRRLAAETGFEARSLEMAIRLADVADAMLRHPVLGSVLVLKGGTALNLLGHAPGRLSVDLDFNYVGAVGRQAMLQRRPAIEQAVTAVARDLGMGVQLSADAFASRKFSLTYASLLGGTEHVKVDLSFLHRVCLLPTAAKRLWRPDGRDRPSVQVLSDAELAAGKLCALLDRTAARDLWDTAHLPELLEEWPPKRLKPVFVALAGALPHALSSYDAARAAHTSQQDVERLLYPMLISGSRPSAKELSDRANKILAPLLDLTDAEREFSERLQSGVLLPELLFPGEPDIAGRLGVHPILLWKAQNAREHAKKKGRTS